MIQQTQIQAVYNDLYEQISKYIWPFNTIEILADLEIAVYTAFPDLSKISRLLKSLEIDLKKAAEDDSELQEAIDAFNELLKGNQEIFIKIPVPMEVEEE
jgi:hypothetical protein